MERRERLQKALADMEEDAVLAAMDALEPADAAPQQFVPSTTFYTEGSPALLDARVAVSVTDSGAVMTASVGAAPRLLPDCRCLADTSIRNRKGATLPAVPRLSGSSSRWVHPLQQQQAGL